jgi:3'(2'), 5'-bisphosphate nucleotidase
MDAPDIRALLDDVIRIAQDAGDAIMTVYSRPFETTAKADASPLTEADLAAHHLIVARLAQLSPALPVLSEESGDAVMADRPTWQRFWLVDPLDGTKEFIKRNGEFTVNIALVDGERPVMGVVHAPALGITYAAAEGVGAFRLENAVRSAIRVSAHQPGSPWRVVASRSHAGPDTEAFLARLGECELLSMGSSLKLCLVAEGKADIYPRLGPTSLWDTAAAQCVVEQAGGCVHDLGGKTLVYGAQAPILNPHFIAASARFDFNG